MQAETRVYLTADRDRVVEEGDPEAAYLLAGAGGTIPHEYAHVYREYRKTKDAPAAAVAEAEPEAKAVERAPENKAQPRAQADRK